MLAAMSGSKEGGALARKWGPSSTKTDGLECTPFPALTSRQRHWLSGAAEQPGHRSLSDQDMSLWVVSCACILETEMITASLGNPVSRDHHRMCHSQWTVTSHRAHGCHVPGGSPHRTSFLGSGGQKSRTTCQHSWFCMWLRIV